MTNHEKKIYNKMTQQNGYKMVGYDYYSEYCKDIHSVDKDLNIPYVEYSTLKCHEYDGEVIGGKGIIYYFPHYVIRSKSKFTIEPGCGFIDITEFTSYHYGDDATVVIKESEMKDVCVKGFRLFICDLINNNIHLLNASKIGYEEDYRKYAAYNLLVNLVEFNNNHKSMIWQHPHVVGQSSCVIALNHNGYWCFNTINFVNSYDVMLYDVKRQIDNNAHNKKDIVKNGNVITVPLDKSKPIIDDEKNTKEDNTIAEEPSHDGNAEFVQPGTAKLTNRYGGKSVVNHLDCDMTGVKQSDIKPIFSTNVIENRYGSMAVDSFMVTKHEAEACARKLAERQNHDATAPKPRSIMTEKLRTDILNRISEEFRDKCNPLLTGRKADTDFKKLWLNENVYIHQFCIVEDLFDNVLNNKELKGYDLAHDPCIIHWHKYLNALVDVYNISKLCTDNGFGSGKAYRLIKRYVEFLYKNYDFIKHSNVRSYTPDIPDKYTFTFVLDEFELAGDIPKMTGIHHDYIHYIVNYYIMNNKRYQLLMEQWKNWLSGIVENFNAEVLTIRHNALKRGGHINESEIFRNVWDSNIGKALMLYIDWLGWHDEKHEVEFMLKVAEDIDGHRYLELIRKVPDVANIVAKQERTKYDPKKFEYNEDNWLIKPGDSTALHLDNHNGDYKFY